MGFTTVATFVDGLTALTWTGVKRTFTEPPTQLTTADLPALFPRIPTGNSSAITLSSARGLRSATVELVVIVQMQSQSTSPLKFDALLTLIDNMHTVIAGAAASLGIDTWQIDSTYTDDGHWAIIATVEASG